jgi:hypothetical protein
MEQCFYRTVKKLNQLWIAVKQLTQYVAPPPTHTYYTREWFMYNSYGAAISVDKPEFDKEHPVAVEHIQRHRPDGRIDSRRAIWYQTINRDNYEPADLFEPVPPPWLLIQCGERDLTEQLSSYICKGNLISLQFLNTKGSNEKWTYVDPKTFEDVFKFKLFPNK